MCNDMSVLYLSFQQNVRVQLIGVPHAEVIALVHDL